MSKLHHGKFARFFPSYHPRAGEPTYFVEKIWESIYLMGDNPIYLGENYTRLTTQMPTLKNIGLQNIYQPKHHTIRAGHHVKPGDFIRPSVWSGKPYKSKRIIIGPDIEVVKEWSFKIHEYMNGFWIDIGSNSIHPMEDFKRSILPMVAANDGLELNGFLEWFKYPKPFDGQIICWNKDVNY